MTPKKGGGGGGAIIPAVVVNSAVASNKSTTTATTTNTHGNGIPNVRRISASSSKYDQEDRRNQNCERILALQNAINVKPTKRQRLRAKMATATAKMRAGASPSASSSSSSSSLLPSLSSLSISSATTTSSSSGSEVLPEVPEVSEEVYATCNGHIEAVHAAKMAHFRRLQDSLPNRERFESTIEDPHVLEKYQEETQRIRDRVDETEYLLATMSILNQYQDILKEEKELAGNWDDNDEDIGSGNGKNTGTATSPGPVKSPGPVVKKSRGTNLLTQLGIVSPISEQTNERAAAAGKVKNKKRHIVAEYFQAIGMDKSLTLLAATIPPATMGAASLATHRKRKAAAAHGGVIRRSSSSSNGTPEGPELEESLSPSLSSLVSSSSSSITPQNSSSSTCPPARGSRKSFLLPACDGCGDRDHSNMTVSDECFLTCMSCGRSRPYVTTEATSYKEIRSYDFIRRFDYERPNHFSERLAQSQCKENIVIPQTVMDLILLELKKDRITDPSKITRVLVKAILKKTKLSKYYEHVPLIMSKLKGEPPLRFEPEMEEQLLVMFKEIQAPFEKHKPPGRRNCLSYPYILYKFCELLERDEFLPCFPLLKSREKLYKTDQVWKKICQELDWEFIPTV